MYKKISILTLLLSGCSRTIYSQRISDTEYIINQPPKAFRIYTENGEKLPSRLNVEEIDSEDCFHGY